MPTAFSSPPANPPAPRASADQFLWAVLRTLFWPLAYKKVVALRCLMLRMCGAKTTLRSEFAGSCHVEAPWLLTIGKLCAIDRRVCLQNTGGLVIGDRTIISRDAHVCGIEPNPTPGTLRPISRPIVIGSNVWIAAGAFIGPGVTIGDGAVVAARAVVTVDAAPWTVVGGDPLRVIKTRAFRQGTSA